MERDGGDLRVRSTSCRSPHATPGCLRWLSMWYLRFEATIAARVAARRMRPLKLRSESADVTSHSMPARAEGARRCCAELAELHKSTAPGEAAKSADEGHGQGQGEDERRQSKTAIDDAGRSSAACGWFAIRTSCSAGTGRKILVQNVATGARLGRRAAGRDDPGAVRPAARHRESRGEARPGTTRPRSSRGHRSAAAEAASWCPRAPRAAAPLAARGVEPQPGFAFYHAAIA